MVLSSYTVICSLHTADSLDCMKGFLTLSFKGPRRFQFIYFLFRQGPFMWGLYFLYTYTIFVRIFLVTLGFLYLSSTRQSRPPPPTYSHLSGSTTHHESPPFLGLSSGTKPTTGIKSNNHKVSEKVSTADEETAVSVTPCSPRSASTQVQYFKL